MMVSAYVTDKAIHTWIKRDRAKENDVVVARVFAKNFATRDAQRPADSISLIKLIF